MGFFESIKNAIFGAPQEDKSSKAPASTIAAAKPVAAGAAAAPKAAPASPAPAAAAPSAENVDVAAILDAAVKSSGQKLNWKTSIVDLMKALGIDSSLSARKELAAELGYTGDTSDSATMNIWLHKKVIQKLKDNGGKVPADLL